MNVSLSNISTNTKNAPHTDFARLLLQNPDFLESGSGVGKQCTIIAALCCAFYSKQIYQVNQFLIKLANH